MRKLSEEQENYIQATTLYLTVQEQYQKRFEELNLTVLYDQDFDKAFELEEQLSKELRYQEAYDLKANAEKALVEWVFECVEFHQLYRDRLEELEPLREQARRSLVTREKIAKIAMKLDVEEV